MKTNFLKKMGIALMAVSMMFSAVAVNSASAVDLEKATMEIDALNTDVEGISQTSGFSVNGTIIRDANGKEFVMRGVNIPHAWYRDKTETSIKAAANLGANVVRIVCADGGQWEKTTRDEIQTIVDICKENHVVCILEAHDATGSNNISDVEKCADYWIEMKDILNENSKYVILNIANEWAGEWTGANWAEGNKKAIQKVRDAGITNMIMIDSAGWGQYPDSIKDYGKSVFESDPNKNTVFSIHMYEYAGGNATTIRNNIDNCLGIGVTAQKKMWVISAGHGKETTPILLISMFQMTGKALRLPNGEMPFSMEIMASRIHQKFVPYRMIQKVRK